MTNEDYTGLDLYNDDWRMIWTEYQSPDISESASKILSEFGLDSHCEDNKDAAELILRFISLSMPNDFMYEFCEKHEPNDKFEPINGWWNKGLNVQFGYGLFDN